MRNALDTYLDKSNWRVNENSNVSYSIGGLILHLSSVSTSKYWLENIYDKDIAEAHQQGFIHLHDLGHYGPYCAGWSLRDLIAEGFNGVADKVSAKPAAHLTTLVNQIVNFLGVMQNEWAGAQAFSSFDTLLAPFVKEEGLSYDQVYQAMQSFIYGINVPSRWGSQAPFSNITLDWTVPEDMKSQYAIYAGKTLNYTYDQCQEEMNLINKALLELYISGDAQGRGFQYPIPTYNITKDFNWSGDNAQLLFELTAKYGTPYFQNFVNSDLKPEDIRSMCCRLQLDKKALRKRSGGIFGSDDLTGSIGVVTLNLPRLAFVSKGDKDLYLGLVSHYAKLASRALEKKREVCLDLLENNFYPYTKRYLHRKFDNHFATIGIIGSWEASSMLDKDFTELSTEVMSTIKELLTQFQEETGNIYNLEATPAEGTSYRLAKHDRADFPGIVTSGTIDDPYYTNSTFLPVDYTDDVFEALDIQDRLQTQYTGGTVFHTFLGERIHSVTACRELVKTIATNYHLPYFSISPTYSICTNHGYIDGEHFDCPICNKKTEVYSRIVGYYRNVNNWNKGKKEEFKDRMEYKGV